MKTLKVLIVANSSEWISWATKIARMKEFFAPKVNLEFTIAHTQFKNVPFQESRGNGAGYYRIDDNWYNANVSVGAKAFDIVMFVMPLYEWKPNLAWGYRTDRSNGPVELQIAANEYSFEDHMENGEWKKENAFFERGRHEIMHALFMISGQEDTTHKWVKEYKLENARDELVFKDFNPNMPETQSILAELVRKLMIALGLLEDLKKRQAEVIHEVIANNQVDIKQISLKKMCDAIEKFEDYVPAGGKYRDGSISTYGSKSWRNKNPGNLRYAQQADSIGQDKTGFAIFKSKADGKKALANMILRAAEGKSSIYRPEMMLFNENAVIAPVWHSSKNKQMIIDQGRMPGFYQIYAPTEDNNFPRSYAKYVADFCGVVLEAKIGGIVNDL